MLLWEIFSLGEIPYQDIHLDGIPNFINSGERLDRPIHASQEMYVCHTYIFVNLIYFNI